MQKTNSALSNAKGRRPASTTLATRARGGRRYRLGGRVATGLLPLLKLLEAVQPGAGTESVFHLRRQQFQRHLALAYAELRATHPRHQVVRLSFRVLAGVLREEAHTIGPDEARQARKELLLATLRQVPALLSAANQARLLS